MNSIQTNLKNEDGTIETLLITSNDNIYPLDVTKTYKLANRIQKKQNKLTHAFKNSILGTEIGVKAEGFSSMAILATIIAVGTLLTMYLFWRI